MRGFWREHWGRGRSFLPSVTLPPLWPLTPTPSEGYIYTQLGKGSFVSPLDQVGGERKTQLLRTFHDTVEELLRLGYTTEQLTAILEENRRNKE